MIKNKMHKKGGFDIRTFVIGLILAMAVTVTYGMYAKTTIDLYEDVTGVSGDMNFVDTYDRLDTIHGEVRDVEDQMEGTDTGNEDSESQFFGGALSSIKITWESFGLMRDLVNDMAGYLSVPPIWIQVTTTVLVFALLATVLFMIFKHTGK